MARTPSVLLVEDNLDDVVLVKEAFRENEIAIDLVVANNAPQAFRHLLMNRNAPPDLVIIDLNLPVITGHVVLRELKAYAPWHRVPMVVFSSSNRTADRESAMALGAAAYIVKPPRFEGYVDIIRQLRPHLGDVEPDREAPLARSRSTTALSPLMILDELARPLREAGRRSAG